MVLGSLTLVSHRVAATVSDLTVGEPLIEPLGVLMTALPPRKPPKPSYSIDTAGPSNPESPDHVDIRVSPPSTTTPKMTTPRDPASLTMHLPPPVEASLAYAISAEPPTFDDGQTGRRVPTRPTGHSIDTMATSLSHEAGAISPADEKAGQSPRCSRGGSPTNTARRKSSTADGKRSSPLAKRLGEDPTQVFMLPHPSKADATNSAYPGVIIGSFADGTGNGMGLDFGVDDIRFDGTMDDILDVSAKDTAPVTSATGPAQPNIAPWLMDDTESSPVDSGEPGDVKHGETSKQGLSHFASVPSLPKLRQNPSGSRDNGSRVGSQPNLYPDGPNGRKRNGSGESMSTLGKIKRPSPMGEAVPLPPGTRHTSLAASRVSRLGSTASNVSGQGSVEKKKGFLGGLLKRKTGQSMSRKSTPPLRREQSSPSRPPSYRLHPQWFISRV